MVAETATFGDLLRRYRKAAGFTQEELAERAGLSRRGINDLERGARQTPHRETLALLSDALALTEEQHAEFLAVARHRTSLPNAPRATDSAIGSRDTALVPQAASTQGVHRAPTALDSTLAADVDPHLQSPGGASSQPSAERQTTATKDERRLVTLLFADVTDSTALGEALDPEDVRALMGRYYQHARRIIAEHGGILEKFIGDAVMAIFGLPHAHGNDAERALAAALALREAVANDHVLADRLELRIGVNTGDVVAAPDVTGGDFLVTGDAVNVAARLQAQARPGEIVAGARTYQATEAAFLFGEARTVALKGKRQPVSVFPLHGPRSDRKISRPPLVGRRRELAQLTLLRDRALEERRPQLVSIVAPAGVGKSRLLEEFLAQLRPTGDSTDGYADSYADGRTTSFRVATARCAPYGETLTYWPLRGLLDSLLDGAPTRERVAQAFVAVGNTPADASRLAGLTLVTLGVEPEESVERESIFHAWRRLIEAVGHQAPLIIVFEDLHWASDSLLDLIEQVLRAHTEAALLVVATSRPELLERRPAWGGGRDNLTAMSLSPLTAAQTDELVTRLTEGLSATTRRRIVEHSGGNPFFAIELVRALTQRVADGDSSPGEPPLPDTVHEAILARLDALAPLEREALQVAAVVGRAFRMETLQSVLNTYTRNAIDVALEGLLARDLIAPADGGSYTFRHILFRDVAYSTLTRAERVRLHAAIALWLERVAADQLDECVELIAYHYQEALLLARASVAPLEAPLDPGRAVAVLERAGELAGWAGAFTEARARLQGAIALAPEAEHIRLYEKLGDCMLLGDTAIQAYQAAFERWQSAGAAEPLTGARILRKLLMMYVRWPATWATQPSATEVHSLLAEARGLAEGSGDTHELWHVRVAEAFWAHSTWVRNMSDNFREPVADEIRALFLEAAAEFEGRQDWVAFSEALDGYAGLSSLTGHYHDAMKALKRRLSAPGVPATERGDAVNMLCHMYLWSGHYARCIATSQAAIARLRPGDPVILLGKGPLWATGAAGLSGRWSALDWLLPALQEGMEQVQQDRGIAYVAAGYFVMLHVALAREDTQAIQAAVATLERLLTPQWTAGARALLTAYRTDNPGPLTLGEFEDVWPYLKMREFRYVGALMLMFLSERGEIASRALRSLAHMQAEDEHAEFMRQTLTVAEAVADSDNLRLASAIDLAEAQGLIPHAARMRIVLAQRMGERAPLERARPTLERLGDRQFLRRLEEAEDALK